MILLNERYDVAIAAGLDGVHLTSTSISADVVRAKCPAEFTIGISTHSISEIERANEMSCDYALFGPVFETPSKKKFGAPQGLERLKVACSAGLDMPVLAVGGINAERVTSVLEAGAIGFAAIGMFDG